MTCSCKTTARVTRVLLAWKKAALFLGCFEDGPASRTPERKGITVIDSAEARRSLMDLATAIRRLKK